MTDIWPVIHLLDEKHTLRNALMAQRNGCPGVFLIAMSGDDSMIDPAAKLIRSYVPSLKIGINMLTCDPSDAVAHSLDHGYDATWSDYAWHDSHIATLIEDSGDHQFFAAVAMKGETHNEPDPEASARLAVANGFIPMTSGHGTGITAPINKIKMLRNAIGPDAPLAMSGVHPPRAGMLTPLATHFLVATCISSDFYTFDEKMLQYLVHQTK
jgi:predicted TIM-barrel enzyme